MSKQRNGTGKGINFDKSWSGVRPAPGSPDVPIPKTEMADKVSQISKGNKIANTNLDNNACRLDYT